MQYFVKLVHHRYLLAELHKMQEAAKMLLCRIDLQHTGDRQQGVGSQKNALIPDRACRPVQMQRE